MAKEKLVWVKATLAVQKPNRTWAQPGDVFQVPEGKVSKRSMCGPSKEEIALAKEGAAADAEADDSKDAEIADLKAKLADAEAGREIMQEAADLLQVEQGELIDTIKRLKEAAAKPASSVAGEKKTADPGAKS